MHKTIVYIAFIFIFGTSCIQSDRHHIYDRIYSDISLYSVSDTVFIEYNYTPNKMNVSYDTRLFIEVDSDDKSPRAYFSSIDLFVCSINGEVVVNYSSINNGFSYGINGNIMWVGMVGGFRLEKGQTYAFRLKIVPLETEVPIKKIQILLGRHPSVKWMP